MFKLIEDDLWLEPYAGDIAARNEAYKKELNNIKADHGSLSDFANGHHYFGFHYDPQENGWWYREWAPEAYGLSLIGEFNQWDRNANQMNRKENGVWETFVSSASYPSFTHESKLKVHVNGRKGGQDRIPAYIHRVIQHPETLDFAGQLWAPSAPFQWSDQSFSPGDIKEMLIYECHTGLAQEKEGVGTYKEFEENVLPRIKEGGYTCIQLMAVQEHPYYGSFGYHVSNFFAASSRFGTPEDLKSLINTAHNMGIAVIMDIVHSHAVKNIAEGLNEFDGTEYQYFHEGPRGNHPSWDSKLFNYGKPEVRHFLLSNLKYWIEEYHFDGFRFDGITSMLYEHHGEMDFDHYDKYFKDSIDRDAITYLHLATHLIKELKPNAIIIAEDMSGMPGLCRKHEDGGLGFDYRLGMGLPDYWIKLLKHSEDEEWDIHELWGTMTNRRTNEKTIAYAESHDQALVGDKSLAFWLMDKEMYFHMHKDDDNIVVERGIALHKMIRLVTAALGGEGYLNFIGNEFGHPEWLDFPREGNNWSYQYARRQWSLVDNPELKYRYLNDFDKAMIHLFRHHQILDTPQAQQLNMDEANKTIIFERGNLIFVFNFHPHNAIPDYELPVPQHGNYKVVLCSDDKIFGGHGRVDSELDYPTYGDHPMLKLYVTNRTATVLYKVQP